MRSRRALLRLQSFLAALVLLVGPVGCGEKNRGEARAPYDADGRALVPLKLVERPPNLVLIVLDTLRADVAADAGAMPTIAKLRERGLSFDQAIAPAPWTLPSLTSVFTGLRPSAHGLDDSRRQPLLPAAITTFAEVLASAAGYDTAAHVGGFWIGPTPSVLSGFLHRSNDFHLLGTRAAVQGWAERRDRARPFFLLLHSFEIHDPYGEKNHPWPRPPAPSGSEVDPRTLSEPWELARAFYLDMGLRHALQDLYGRQTYLEGVTRYINDGYAESPRPELARELKAAYVDGARWTDGLLADALALLEGWGLMENTLLVVTSDHGEAFGEHGTFGHGRVMYDELLHVPLVMAGPPPFQGGGRVTAQVGLIDLMPTFLDLIGLPPLADVHASSFLPVVRGKGGAATVVSEERLHRGNMGREIEGWRVSVRSVRWKYIVTYAETAGTVTEELYDLAADPEEQRDLAAREGRVPPDAGLDRGFCEAVEGVRDRIWTVVADRQRIVGTPYGVQVERIRTDRPPRACAREGP